MSDAEKLTQAAANDISQRVANHGGELGLRGARCLVQYVAPDWTLKTFCDDTSGRTFVKAKCFPHATENLAASIEEEGKRLMASLEAEFNTKH